METKTNGSEQTAREKPKKKKKTATSCRNATKTTQNERESVFFTNRVAYYAPEGAANVSTASSCV
jgi:hypothetical protein